jgi:hypothetical protein
MVSVTRHFALTWDYLCPFARNAHEAVVAGIREGKDWDVRFHAFSLNQVHLEEGAEPVWERPPAEGGKGVLALQWGIAVREHFPDRFLDFHLGVYHARFDESLAIHEEETLRVVAAKVGLDPEAVAAEVASGAPAKILAAEHTEAVDAFSVFGVPTIIDGSEAVFVRLMERGDVAALERALDLVADTRINEFKRTTIPR